VSPDIRRKPDVAYGVTESPGFQRPDTVPVRSLRRDRCDGQTCSARFHERETVVSGFGRPLDGREG